MSTLEITEAIQKLSTEEKYQLIDTIAASIPGSDTHPPAWHGEILAERRKIIDSGEANFVSLDEVIERGTFRRR